MSYCRHILASVEIGAVTQARASGDYHPGSDGQAGGYDQWHNVGTTGLLAWALGIAPSKDNFWCAAPPSHSVRPQSSPARQLCLTRRRLPTHAHAASHAARCPEHGGRFYQVDC